MPDPLVSIVVCTYNGEAFLRQQLDSLVNQTYINIEILVVDDRSSDSSASIAREYAEKDERVRVIINPTNLGYNKNFEQSFYLSKGEFIAVSDQDDIWASDKISKMLPLFSNEKILLAHCQSVRFTDQIPQNKTYNKRQLFTGNDVRKLMFFNTIAGHNIMFRKNLLQHDAFPTDVFYDWWLALLAATYGEVVATNEVLTFHRFHNSNLTLGKNDERKQNRNKADERLRTLISISELKGLTPSQKQFAIELQKAVLTLKEKKFSLSLFKFLSRNSRTVFFFKKKSLFSKLKMAYRMSFAVS